MATKVVETISGGGLEVLHVDGECWFRASDLEQWLREWVKSEGEPKPGPESSKGIWAMRVFTLDMVRRAIIEVERSILEFLRSE